ncbi:MAG: KpsF/GutQ family sugar-phosphate isomerase [Chloroherpetonaceae bacterium]|nr:KpsF/GutQ family sugar-phosphate isomerase [Chloroherpetonaceae bacterium]
MNKEISFFESVLIAESQAIQKAAARLNSETIKEIIEAVIRTKGVVYFAGVGKSAFIARKAASSLRSVGRKSHFLSFPEMLHGDLGAVSGSDIFIAISHSGGAEELKSILPILNERGVAVIAITGNQDGYLAKMAKWVLSSAIDEEACPLSLLPSSSTTLALALCDAIVLSVVKFAEVKKEDFAKNHPAGFLGKKLTLKVRDLMHQAPNLPMVFPDASFLSVIQALTSPSLGAVIVVDSEQKMLGIITDGDLRRALEKFAEAIPSRLASDFMTINPISTSPEVLAFDALEMMENRPSQISVLPVVDSTGKTVGLLRLHDVVRGYL